MDSECFRPGCSNIITPNPKAKRPRLFCSNACRQKSYRLRHTKRNDNSVTITSYSQVISALGGLTQNQLESLRERIDIRLQSFGGTTSLLYYRKGNGVVHLAVERNVTFCIRETADMTELTSDEGLKVCQRCATVRDTKTWWRGWREAFGDTDKKD